MDDSVRKYLSKIGQKGGKKKAELYDMSAMGAKGGRAGKGKKKTRKKLV